MLNRERMILRDLAKRLAEVASLPVQAERRRCWTLHNDLKTTRPLVLVFPEGAWEELLPESALCCESDAARAIEGRLRQRLYYHDHLQDDTVVEKSWTIHTVMHSSGWGLEPKRIPSPERRGAWRFDPVIHEPADMKKLKFPEITVDERATEQALDEAQELFGDLLDVQLKGVAHISFHLMSLYTDLRGLEQVMMDMVLNPAWVHDAMAFLTAGHQRLIRQYVDMNLLSLNNDDTYHSSGGNGYTEQLPAPGSDPSRVRPIDMWASAEAQELAGVSPAMHNEFSTTYEKVLLAPFGLNGYGCCEALDAKLDDVLTIPNIRRVSIAPAADVDVCAERLRNTAIFSWKPNPAHLVGAFDEDRIRAYIRHTVEVAETHSCVLEMILKDTHTCEHRPERFDRWVALAREAIEEGIG